MESIRNCGGTPVWPPTTLMKPNEQPPDTPEILMLSYPLERKQALIGASKGPLPNDNGPRHAKTNAGGRLRQMILCCTELKYACRRCARWNFLTCPFFICKRWKY